MSANRIKGQDVSLQVAVDGSTQVGLDNIRDVEFTYKLEKSEEGYIGQKSDQYDEIFKGVDGKVSIHSADAGVFDFIDAVVSRAQRRTPGTVVNIRATLRYPNGQRPRFIFPDCSFGDIPVAFGSRAAFGTLTIPFSCSQPQRIG